MTTTKKLLTLGMTMLFAFIATSCSDDNSAESATDTKPWPYDANMDTTVSPGDDFFMYCNGTWWKNYDLNGNYYWGFCAYETEEYIENYKKKMNSPALNRIKDDIRNIDNSTDAALAAIGKALQITEGIETNEDAWRAIGKALKMGYQPFFKFTLIPRSRVMKACLGKSDDSDDETGKLANPYSLRYLSTHPERLDDFVPLAKMKTRSTGYAMLDCIFSELGIPESDATIDEEVLDWYKRVQELSPEEIKERIHKCIMRDICFASNKDFEENKSLYGIRGTMDDAMQNFYDVPMAYILSHDYIASLDLQSAKVEMTEICKQLIDVLKRRVDALDWMSEPTKAQAKEKLDKMILNIGFPDKWVDAALPQLTGSSLVEDMMQIRIAWFDGLKSLIGKQIEEDDNSFNIWLLYGDLSLMIDNAFYEPIDNSITILPIYLMEPYYSKDYSDAFNYSTFSSTLGHEITHALDIDGSKYDAVGNNRNWWTVADKMEFNTRQQKLVNCFNLLEIMPDALPNVYADGTKTLGENTADLGGLLVGRQAYMEKLEREGYSREEMTKQDRKLFQAYAEQWRAKYTPSYAIWLKENDEHSLPRERINGIVMNIDRWYELFDVKFGNILYLTPETRARIW